MAPDAGAPDAPDDDPDDDDPDDDDDDPDDDDPDDDPDDDDPDDEEHVSHGGFWGWGWDRRATSVKVPSAPTCQTMTPLNCESGWPELFPARLYPTTGIATVRVAGHHSRAWGSF
jgi:hypothetical protein